MTSKNPVKVLQIINDLGMGGGEIYVLKLSGILPKDQYEVVCTCKKGQIFHKNLLAEGIRPFVVDLSKKMAPVTVMKTVKFVSSQGIDILHAHGATGSLYGRMVSVITGRPLVTTYHVAITKITDITWLKRLFYSYADRILSLIDKKIIAVSEAVKKEMVERLYFRDSRVEVLYAGVDLEGCASITRAEARERLGLCNKASCIGVTGRLSPEKGIHVLLKAMSLLTKDIPDAFLIITGDGPIKEKLINQAASLGLTDRCLFLGYREDVPDILAALDLLVLPSLTEGFPLIVLEGMANAKPVIASKIGGVTEQIVDGE
ncbi:MAG: glycosyltransferase family 4 protein, partial [Thermodesulfobacteriota bacterium]|nr:glycosyltransferase family 4 protein [Thermodesulfobacteriota bacterium]